MRGKPTGVAKQSYLTDDLKIVDHIICDYEDYPSVRHIKKLYLFLLTISEQDLKKILKALSTEKSTGVNLIPSRLVKLTASYLAGPLSQSVNNSIRKRLFPENAKVVSVSRIDKKTLY